MVVRLALAPWTARLTLAIGVLFRFVGWVWRPRYRPSMRRTLRRSASVTWTSRPRRRLRAGVFFSSSWFSRDCRRTSLPVLVTRKRREAPRWLFILGTGSPWTLWRAHRGLAPGAPLGLAGREHRDHVAPVLAGRAVDLGDLDEVGGQPLQQPPPELGVGHLAAAEHDGDLDLVALLEEPLDVTLLGLVVVRVDLGPHLHLFEGHQVLLAPGFLGLDGLLVLELRVVHQLDHRRAGHRGHLDHVEVLGAGHPQGLLGVHHPELFAGGADHPDLRGPDPVVDPWFNADATSLLVGRPPNQKVRRKGRSTADRWVCV